MRKLAGCIPILDGKVCLLDSKKHPGKLVLPKGGVENGEAESKAAAREAMEEAGLEGRLGVCLGFVGDAHWYVMQVEKVHDSWLEMTERSRYWLSIKDALSHSDVMPKSRLALDLFAEANPDQHHF